MMMGLDSFIERLKDADYLELIRQRDKLIKDIERFEKKETAGDRSGKEWEINPGPDVKYQMNLEYLSALSSLMQEKYNQEYVWGDKTLYQHAGK